MARLGGDEFVVVSTVPRAAALSASKEHRNRVRSALSAPFRLEGAPVAVGASVGVAVGLDPEQGPQHLLRAADRDIYGDKNARRRRADDVPLRRLHIVDDQTG